MSDSTNPITFATAMKLKGLMAVLVMLVGSKVSAQEIYSAVRGLVKDAQSGIPLPGVVVTLDPLDSVNMKKALTDLEGLYRFEKVRIGKHTIAFEMLQYDMALLQNQEVISSKELIVNISLQEKVHTAKEVVIVAEKDKTKANNEMTSVSTRILSIEESKRYAGSLNDVSRMAQNFAGVQGADDSRNDIVVRGNSPIGVLYRLEGLDIPNPNHFAVDGTTGGPISMLNNNVLANSDFMTGAFPAEYGNATSGVFDLKMRNGNNETHEFLAQIGFNGAEVMAEGPISKKKRSSYMVSYRYSTLEIFKKLGLEFGTASVPEYQDVSFMFNFPHKKGTTKFFGLGGISKVEFLDSETDSTDLFAFGGFDTRFDSYNGVAGLSHTYFVNSDGYLKLTLGATYHSMTISNDSVSTVTHTAVDYYKNNSATSRQSARLTYNQKIGPQHTFRAGLIADRIYLSLSDSIYRAPTDNFFVLSDYDGDVWLSRGFVQWQYRPTNKLTFNSGLYTQTLDLNNEWSLEPRVGMRYAMNRRNTLSAAYGMHSIMPPTDIYFENVNTAQGPQRVNEGLGFMKAHHFVFGYDRIMGEKLRLKTETYYQILYNVPVDISPSAYSLLNEGAGFGLSFPDTLVNTGNGINYGLEITFEQFLNQGLYYLLTVSLYDSKYEGSNGVEFNTAFSGNYTINLVGGKEFELSRNRENKKRKSYLTIDARVTWQGGQRYTPILLQESVAANRAVYDWENAYSEQFKDYFRADVRVGFKMSGKKVTQEWGVDLQNVSDRENIFRQEYNTTTQEVNQVFQIGFLPIALYRITF